MRSVPNKGAGGRLEFVPRINDGDLVGDLGGGLTMNLGPVPEGGAAGALQAAADTLERHARAANDPDAIATARRMREGWKRLPAPAPLARTSPSPASAGRRPRRRPR